MDSFDKHHLNLRIHHRTRKWTISVFWSMLKFTESNSWSMARFKLDHHFINSNCSRWNKLNLNQKEFLAKLANRLLFSIAPRSLDLPQRLNSTHSLVNINCKAHCWLCYHASNTRSSTQKYCLRCRAYLHQECFHLLHSTNHTLWEKLLSSKSNS